MLTPLDTYLETGLCTIGSYLAPRGKDLTGGKDGDKAKWQ